jgi:hypothetical protein
MVWVTGSALGGNDAQAPPTDPRILGVSEAVLHYCAEHDPGAAATLRRRIDELVRGRSAPELGDLRDSQEYRKAYEAVAQFTDRIDPHNVARFCAQDPTAQQ